MGDVAEWVRELIRGICKKHEVEILKGQVSSDHVHLFVLAAPHLSISKLVQYLKGKSSYKRLQEDKNLSRLFVATSGTITDEMIIGYIQNQDTDSGHKEEDFTIG